MYATTPEAIKFGSGVIKSHLRFNALYISDLSEANNLLIHSKVFTDIYEGNMVQPKLKAPSLETSFTKISNFDKVFQILK